MKYLNLCLLSFIFILFQSGSPSNIKTNKGYLPGNQFPETDLLSQISKQKKFSGSQNNKTLIILWTSHDASSRINQIQLSSYVDKYLHNIDILSVSLDQNRAICERTLTVDNLKENKKISVVQTKSKSIREIFERREKVRSFLVDDKGHIIDINLSNKTLLEKV